VLHGYARRTVDVLSRTVDKPYYMMCTICRMCNN